MFILRNNSAILLFAIIFYIHDSISNIKAAELDGPNVCRGVEE